METIIKILDEIRSNSSTKAKAELLTQNKDNELLKKILKYCYDSISYVYGVSTYTIEKFKEDGTSELDMFTLLDKLNAREFTGNKALSECKKFVNSNAYWDVFYRIIDRDFKLGVSSKTLNKIWKNLIPTPNYCRCSTFSKGVKIEYPAIVQLKCDGTYREAQVMNGMCKFRTRSGEEYENPVLSEIMKDYPEGVYTGEFTIGRADEPDTDRLIGNGLINSNNPPFEKIHFTVWDYLSIDEYNLKTKSKYITRFERLVNILGKDELVNIVPSVVVSDENSALKVVANWMAKGLEGGVLKDPNMTFKNGTSREQFKIKLKVDVEMRCTGFKLGTEGTKYEGKNKVILFENDEKTIIGQCSGMTDAMIEEVTKHPEKYIGKIVSVQFNDLIKATGSKTYSLSHPRFAEWRDDKDSSDTLEKAFELRDMAKNL